MLGAGEEMGREGAFSTTIHPPALLKPFRAELKKQTKGKRTDVREWLI